jgi:hypothetical protein
MPFEPPGSLDLVIGDDSDEPPGARAASSDRPWIGVHFDCCGVYARVFRDRAAAAYVGACPRCRRSLRVPIGPEGTSQRLFRAS